MRGGGRRARGSSAGSPAGRCRAARAARSSRRSAPASATTSGASSPRTSVAPGLHHRELLARDVGDRRAEPARVLEPDVGEHDHVGAEHVGRVVAAAQAGLDHGDLDLAPRQLVERGRGQQLELGDAIAVAGPVDLRRGRRGALDRGAELRRPTGRASPTRIRSANVVRCGDRYAPVRTPVRLQQRRREPHGRGLAVGARRRARRGSAPAASPSAVSSRRIRSRPKRIPNSSSESRCSSARPRSHVLM